MELKIILLVISNPTFSVKMFLYKNKSILISKLYIFECYGKVLIYIAFPYYTSTVRRVVGKGVEIFSHYALTFLPIPRYRWTYHK